MSILDLFENPEYLKARDAFHEDLLAIEEKYKYWFENRPPIFETDKHDMLHNHYTTYKTSQSIRFMFNKETDLPASIMDECFAAFKKHFGENQN